MQKFQILGKSKKLAPIVDNICLAIGTTAFSLTLPKVYL